MIGLDDISKYLKRTQLLSGTPNDVLLEWMQILTSNRGPLQDLLEQYLRSLGYTGPLNDRMNKYLGDLGYTGSVYDKLEQAIADSKLFTDPFFDATLYLNFASDYYNSSDWLCTYVPDPGTETDTTLFIAFDGNYYTKSDIFCSSDEYLILDFTAEQYVIPATCP